MMMIYIVHINSYTMAVRDFADIYTQSPRAASPRDVGVYFSKISSSHGISDIYHLGHTHQISERTTEHSPHLFYTLTSDDRLWFQLRRQIALTTLFLCRYVSTQAGNFCLLA